MPGTRDTTPQITQTADLTDTTEMPAIIVATESGRDREAFRRAALGRHHVNFAISVVFRGVGNLFSVRRKSRESSVTRTARQPARDAAIFADGIKLARVAEHNVLIVGRRKTKEPGRFRQVLGRGSNHRDRGCKKCEKKGSRAHKSMTKLVRDFVYCKNGIARQKLEFSDLAEPMERALNLFGIKLMAA